MMQDEKNLSKKIDVARRIIKVANNKTKRAFKIWKDF
jgi:hypothetical protein